MRVNLKKNKSKKKQNINNKKKKNMKLGLDAKGEYVITFYGQNEDLFKVRCTGSLFLHSIREKFKMLWEEIEDEYEFTIVDDVKVTQEKIPNQLSNLYVVRLHKQLFTFQIKD